MASLRNIVLATFSVCILAGQEIDLPTEDCCPGPTGLQAILKLSDSQYVELQELTTAMSFEFQPILLAIATSDEALGAAMRAEVRDPTAIGSVLVGIAQLQRQMRTIGAGYRERARGKLTAEQLVALEPYDEAALRFPLVPEALRYNLITLPDDDLDTDPASGLNGSVATSATLNLLLSWASTPVRPPDGLREALSLTDTQVDQLVGLAEELRARASSLSLQIEDKTGQLERELDAETPNEAIVGMVAIEVVESLAILNTLAGEYRERALGVLTAGQIAVLEPISRAAEVVDLLFEAAYLNLVELPGYGGGPPGGLGLLGILQFATLFMSADPDAVQPPAEPPAEASYGEAAVTQGVASATFSCGNFTRSCTGPAPRFIEAQCGMVATGDGTAIQVPAVPAEGPDPTDLYNDCSGGGHNPSHLSDLEVVPIDPFGEEVTGFLFSDNYYELYVNGSIVARDPIGFVPFNSGVVAFRAQRPLTFAVKLADWETRLGVGMYDNWYVGDGGFVANFSDGTQTGADWKCRAFYISPLDDPSCVRPGPDSSACPKRPACANSDPATCKALHYPVPDDWAEPGFDDSDWLPASTYSASAVTNQPAYADYRTEFGGAEFIWSRNRDQDNLVLCRVTVQ